MSASSVYIGLWINWSHGAVAGSTITLSNRAGGFLTAFLAILVSFAGAACWRITSYAVHQCRASRDYKDTLHHQQQVILCNTGSPAGALWTFVQLPWYWRRNAVRSFLRVLPLALLALLNSAAFGIAGIFSSEVIKAAGNETLIRSPNCGLLTLTAGAAETVQNAAAFASMELNDTLAATTYSWACYDNTQNILGCSQFVQQQLHWTSKTNATCPFSPDLCIYGGTAAYEMDTGLLDTHTHLGINAAKPDRVQYRKVTSCSPIHSKGHVETFNQTSPNLIATGDLFYRYLYGPIVNESDYTYQYDTHASTDIQEYTLTYAYFAKSRPTFADLPTIGPSYTSPALPQTLGYLYRRSTDLMPTFLCSCWHRILLFIKPLLLIPSLMHQLLTISPSATEEPISHTTKPINGSMPLLVPTNINSAIQTMANALCCPALIQFFPCYLRLISMPLRHLLQSIWN